MFSATARRCLLLLYVTLSGYWVDTAAAADAPLRLGIHPYLPAAELHTRFQPLADYLGKAIGRTIEIRIGRDYEEHIQAVGTNRVDIGFMGPVLYVKLVKAYGPRPLLARLEVNGKPELTGAIVVRKDSPIHTLTDIKGHRFAFGDPDSTMGHIVPAAMMAQADVPLSGLSEYKFLGAHKNVAIGVLAGDYDAGAVKMEILNEYAGRGLRLLTAVTPVSEHLLLTRSDLPTEQVEQLRQALLNLKNLPEGASIMHAINKGMTAFVPVADADYDTLRTLMQLVAPNK